MVENLELQTKEDQLKDKIYKLFLECRNEACPDRNKSILQLWEQIIKWYGKYITNDAYEMGKEIYDIIRRLINKDSNTLQEKESFIRYLISALKTGKAEYHRNFISKNTDDIIRMKERNIGRKLTEDERLHFSIKWNDFENTKNLNYQSIFSKNNSDEINEHEQIQDNSKTKIICKAIKAVLDKKQHRSRGCYHALFTLSQIKNETLYPVLDQNIIETYKKSGIKPKQYEIYQKYHPGTTKESAEAIASKLLKDFTKDLETYLKENNPEIFS